MKMRQLQMFPFLSDSSINRKDIRPINRLLKYSLVAALKLIIMIIVKIVDIEINLDN